MSVGGDMAGNVGSDEATTDVAGVAAVAGVGALAQAVAAVKGKGSGGGAHFLPTSKSSIAAYGYSGTGNLTGFKGKDKRFIVPRTANRENKFYTGSRANKEKSYGAPENWTPPLRNTA